MKVVLHRFGPTNYEDPSETLTRLKHVTTFDIYQAEFERLSQRIDDLPEKYLIGCFDTGLRDEIRLDVKFKQPKSLSDAIKVARLIEEHNQLERKTNTTF